MKLSRIVRITARLELLTGLHIGSGNNEMHIGGTDNPIIKHPITNEPYIPGSSLKGKMRSLLEWRAGIAHLNDGKPVGYTTYRNEIMKSEQKDHAKAVLQLFGVSGSDQLTASQAREIGPTRLSFWDCGLEKQWQEMVEARSLLLTETKMENQINRITGVAQHPRNTERVPAGACFNFKLFLRVIEGDDAAHLKGFVLDGLKLIEWDALGGSGSRGYGKVTFRDLCWDASSIDGWETRHPFEHPFAA